ncbi:MAG TPA: PKD domain-containing protein, partial [Solirubrobacter sp.]
PGWLGTTVFSATNYGSPRAAMAPGGATVVAWQELADGEPITRAAYREPGGSFVTTTIDLTTTEVGYQPSVAISPKGTAIVAWAQKDDAGKWRVAASVRPAGGSWGAAQILSGPGTNPPEPVVAIGGNDEAWLLWHRTPLSAEIVEGVRRPPNGGWGSVESLSSTGPASKPRLVMDQAGNATAVWISNTELVSSVRPAGGAWSLPTSPSDSTTSADYPDLAVGTQGRVAVVWKRLYPISETRAAYRDQGGAWSDSTKIGSVSFYTGDAPTVAIDPLGGITATWSMGFNIDVNSRLPGGAWAPTTANISVGSYSDAYAPRVVGGPSGEVIIAWHATAAQGGNRIQVRVRDPSGGWGVIQDPAGETASSATIAMDGQGNAFVAWAVVGGIRGRAYDVAGPDLGTPAPSAPLVAGTAGEFGVEARDRWSALGDITWDFGDGSTGSGARPAHTYAQPGTYHVVVTAVDALGSTTSRATDVIVAAAASDPPVTPLPISELSPAPPAATPTAAPTHTPAPRKPSKNRSIKFSRGYVTPGVSRAKACHGKVTLTLKTGKKTLASRTARLDSKCRYSATFSVRRSLLEGRSSLTVIVKFGGNKYLGATTNRFTIRLTDG